MHTELYSKTKRVAFKEYSFEKTTLRDGIEQGAWLARELRQTVARCDRGSPANYGNLHWRHGWPGTALYVDTDKAMPWRVLAKCSSNHPPAGRTGRQNGPRYCR